MRSEEPTTTAFGAGVRPGARDDDGAGGSASEGSEPPASSRLLMFAIACASAGCGAGGAWPASGGGGVAPATITDGTGGGSVSPCLRGVGGGRGGVDAFARGGSVPRGVATGRGGAPLGFDEMGGGAVGDGTVSVASGRLVEREGRLGFSEAGRDETGCMLGLRAGTFGAAEASTSIASGGGGVGAALGASLSDG